VQKDEKKEMDKMWRAENAVVAARRAELNRALGALERLERQGPGSGISGLWTFARLIGLPQ